MHSEPLDYLPLWLFFILSTGFGWLALECGYRLGRYRHTTIPGEKEDPVGTMVGSILGLLAIILAFTFNLSASRFDGRRFVILEEANAIGTTYLRAQLLPEPNCSEVSRLLREYVDLRLKIVGDGNITQGLAQSQLLHEKLWEQVKDAADKSSSPFMVGQFMQSLNQVIDLHAKRVFMGLYNRIPTSIWLALILLELVGMMTMGYQAGLAATQRSPVMVMLAMAFACILFLIVDLDRSQEGFLRVSQQAMIDLQKTIQPGSP